MKTQTRQCPAVTLCGLTLRTTNQAEMNPKTAKIGPLVHRFITENVAEHIPNRSQPGTLIAAYSDFVDEDRGEYRYWIGELTDTRDRPAHHELDLLSLPAGEYQQFTTETGPLPSIVIAAWQRIWQMQPHEFDGKRRFSVDYEVYDARCQNPEHATVDLFVSVTRPPLG